MGRRGEPRRAGQRRGPALLRATTPCTGCATTTSTACGSTPSTPSSTASAVHLLEQLAVRGRARSPPTSGGRSCLIAESDLNDPRLVRPPRGRRLRPRRAVERRLPPRASTPRSPASATATTPTSARSPTSPPRCAGFVLRRPVLAAPRPRATAGRSATCPAHRFLGYAQNHDQVGNRAHGRPAGAPRGPEPSRGGRGPRALRRRSCPMLFQGEEWGGVDAVPVLHRPRRPRARPTPCARAGAGSSRPSAGSPRTSPTRRTRRPSSGPASTGTSWAAEPHADLLAWHRDLIALRRSTPALTDGRLDRVRAHVRRRPPAGSWCERGPVTLVANLGDEPRTRPGGRRAPPGAGTGVGRGRRPAARCRGAARADAVVVLAPSDLA